jgi:hypothetical protein
MPYELYRQLSNGHLEWICVESSEADARRAAAAISAQEMMPIVALVCQSDGSTVPAWRLYQDDVSAMPASSETASRDMSAAI